MSILRWMSALLLMFSAVAAIAQQGSAALFNELRWRCIGPFRAGRTVAIAGIPDQPNIFFMAPNNGGVWKTDDFGRTWSPIFDGQPAGSVGRHDEPDERAVRQRETDRPEHCASNLWPGWSTAGRSSRSESHLCCRTRTSLWSQCRTRSLPLDGWRTNFSEDPLQGREHRSDRSGFRSNESADDLRGYVGITSSTMEYRRFLQCGWKRSL